MKVNRRIMTSIVAIWALAVGIGAVWMLDYAERPGRIGKSPVRLPAGIIDKKDAQLPVLLVFIHPYCPCSRATLAELARLAAYEKNSVEIYVFFYQPENETPAWTQTDLREQASIIPKVSVSEMSEKEMQRFGATVSGQTLLYDPQGNLIFSGGLTNGRGHEGNNLGRQVIERYLQTGELIASRSPVFGCIITTPEE